MSLDGIVVSSIVEELNEKILGGRIDKIYQQEKDEILINIYNKGENHRLLISASSNSPRIHLTQSSKPNPQNPPMFCMLLRKHLAGGRVLNVEQFLMDRIIFIDISSIDELGMNTEKRLIVEIMGRHSNIILIDKENLKIIDSVKRVNYEISRVRQVLPGLKYEYTNTDKINPSDLNEEEFYTLLKENNANTLIFKFFYSNYMGLSPLIGKEICYDANIDIKRTIISLDLEERKMLYNSFKNIVNKIKQKDFTPVLIKNNYDNSYLAFHTLDIEQFGNENKLYLDSISQVLDQFYYKNDMADRINQKSQSMAKTIETKLERSQKKLSKQKEELLEAKDREKYKIYGDLISANLYAIEKGSKEIEVENFYSENLDKIKIPLDKRYSGAENAQRYYKKYSKLKNANILLSKQILETEDEINYLEHVLNSIDNCEETIELEEIKEELIKEGYLKGGKKNKKKTVSKTKPLHYISEDGFHIYVGKNNRQNDYLSLRFAQKEDLWLHVQKMPGSHVIIKSEGQDIPDSTLEESAVLAAYYSKGKHSKNVAVDYTHRKNVRKPKGAKTGMVIYENFNTIFVNPSKEIISNIKKVED
ncbi:MAG: fibronectin/fibrinogen-binding protein [Tissierellia bacterium]|nr:fibronectin/fibrinogen-binding protein [Tissierellia bacterium]